MRLARIEIENFKGIGEARQAIDLAPITLLFGPNSAGKSTVLQALHYAREILERGNADPDQTIAGGLIDLGGFAALVHNHELNREIVIKLTFSLPEGQGQERLPLNSGEIAAAANFAELVLLYLSHEPVAIGGPGLVMSFAVGLRVRWSELLKAPFVSALEIDLNGAPLAAIRSAAQTGRAQATAFNFAHPLLSEPVDPDNDADQPVTEGDPFFSPLGRELWELSRDLVAAAADQAKNDADPIVGCPPDIRVGVTTTRGALPDLLRPLRVDLIDIDEAGIRARHASATATQRLTEEAENRAREEIAREHARRVGLASLLDEMLLGPARMAHDYLSAMTYLGPLREIPHRGFRPRLSPDESRWARGLAGWDLLYSDVTGALRSEVNTWLSGEGKLGATYQIEKADFVEIPIPSRLSLLFERGVSSDDIGELQDLYAGLTRRSEIALRDMTSGVVVAPSDIGVGISQMVPVIVGCLRESEGLFAIEQPELHIHPAMQVGLGDLFAFASKWREETGTAPKALLLETHSEHIMLRLLRRIRETVEGELPPGAPSLSPESLSVVYVETAEGGVSFTPLRVDARGDFLDRWPKGFFEERAEELF